MFPFLPESGPILAHKTELRAERRKPRDTTAVGARGCSAGVEVSQGTDTLLLAGASVGKEHEEFCSPQGDR